MEFDNSNGYSSSLKENNIFISYDLKSYEKFNNVYSCDVCGFKWGEKYFDGYPREFGSRLGLVCPKCNLKKYGKRI